MKHKLKKVGKYKILTPRFHGRAVGQQKFEVAPGVVEEYSCFQGRSGPSLVFALDKKQNVIALRHLRVWVGDCVLEVPGGNKNSPKESPATVAKRELLEETGYKAGKLIKLKPHKSIIISACYHDPFCHPFLALNCALVGKRRPDPHEHLQVELIPLKKWIQMMYEGKIADFKSIAVTTLALKELGVKIKV